MQHLNWDDLRVLLAAGRAQSFADAGADLGVNGTTVARRIRALEDLAGGPLLRRDEAGRIDVTALGRQLISRAEEMEAAADRLIQDLDQAKVPQGRKVALKGRVRVTAVPVLINRFLVPRLGRFSADHPGLEIETVPTAEDLSLTRRQADIALRFNRPAAGGHEVLARRIADMPFAVYHAVRGGRADWLLYDAAMAHLPQARWLAARAAKPDGQASGLRVMDLESAIEAVAAGAGRSLLPRFIADHDKRLRRLSPADALPMVTREVWLLSHKRDKERAAVRAVQEFIEDEMNTWKG